MRGMCITAGSYWQLPGDQKTRNGLGGGSILNFASVPFCRAAHAASLEDEGARELIARARPLIASFEDRAELRPEGGKGLRAQSS